MPRRDSRRRTSALRHDEDGLADLATGALVSVADAAAHPLTTLRRQARVVARRGEPVNRVVARQTDEASEQVMAVAGGFATGRLPERFALEGVRLVKAQARRDDLVGDIAYGALSAFNSAVKRALGTLTRFEHDSEPPRRERLAPASRRRSGGTTSPRRRASSAPARRRTTARRGTAARRSQAEPEGSERKRERRQARPRRQRPAAPAAETMAPEVVTRPGTEPEQVAAAG